MKHSVHIPLVKFCKDNDLEIVFADKEEISLSSYSITRPGLELSGFYKGFDSKRIMVLGNTEYYFLSSMSEELQNKRLEKLLSFPAIPCVIIARGLPVSNTILMQAKKMNCPVLTSKKITSILMNDLFYYLNHILAPQMSMHGVLMDVSGIGVLITGNSGVGKSETAIELIKRGHRLVADDNVLLKKISNRLIGYAPQKIQHFMELRGVGIINIKEMYGSGSILNQKDVKLVMELENWQEGKEYERLGNAELYQNILGIDIMKHIIPVKPGRNLSIIVEAAARNYSGKTMGYDAAKDLLERTFFK